MLTEDVLVKKLLQNGHVFQKPLVGAPFAEQFVRQRPRQHGRRRRKEVEDGVGGDRQRRYEDERFQKQIRHPV